MSIQFLKNVPVAQGVPLTSGGTSKIIQSKFRHFTISNISPSTANVQARINEPGVPAGSALWFPLVLGNPSKLDRKTETQEPWEGLEVLSDTPGTTISGYWSLTDEYTVEPAGAPSLTATLEGVDGTTGTLEPISALVNGQAHGESLAVAGVNQFINTTVTDTGGSVTLDSVIALGLVRLVIDIQGTSGESITALTGNGYASVGLDGQNLTTPVYDQNGFLISQVGKIYLWNLGGGALGRYVFYVDGATYNPVVLTFPSYTGTAGGVNLEIAAGPVPSSMELKQYPARQTPIADNTATGVTDLIAPVTGQGIWVFGMSLGANETGASVVEFTDYTPTTLWISYFGTAAEILAESGQPIFTSANGLQFNNGGTNDCTVNLQFGLVGV